MQPTAAPANRSLAERLRGVRVDVRDDLVVSRDVFQRTPAYVVRDPITFQSHRLSPQDYRIFCRIEAGYTLGELFEKLTSEGLLQRADEEQFYQFVFMLHRLAFLNLPVSDEALLYKRYAAKKKARVARRWTSILFLQIPLFDPDLFLQRTLPRFAWLFTRTALAGWCVLVAAALTVLGSRAGEVHQPLDSILDPANLPGLWLTLIALKTMHEFGHAYACRKFGGHVPAMGVYFILFTPC
ncbi:MAG: hypothetical protein HZB38_07160, partial [Planctomycetes bacterium]|nr:hypothetical protein [Planctomycetota bacterium]